MTMISGMGVLLLCGQLSASLPCDDPQFRVRFKSYLGEGLLVEAAVKEELEPYMPMALECLKKWVIDEKAAAQVAQEFRVTPKDVRQESLFLMQLLETDRKKLADWIMSFYTSWPNELKNPAIRIWAELGDTRALPIIRRELSVAQDYQKGALWYALAMLSPETVREEVEPWLKSDYEKKQFEEIMILAPIMRSRIEWEAHREKN